MKWTELAKAIELQDEIVEQLADCEKTFARAAYATDIQNLSEPEKTEQAYESLKTKLDPDPENVKMLLCQFYVAAAAWDKYRELGIPEKVYYDTMAAMTRLIGETKAYAGRLIIDKVFWTYRQVGLIIFRLGALEYELKRKGHVIRIHIPSDADFSPDSVMESLKQVRPFCRKYFPDFADVDIACGSWLLSDALRDMLPETSNIRKFQDLFDINEYDRDSTSFIQFLFQVNKDTPYADLPERTSLQRKAKAFLIGGGRIGTGSGKLKMEIEGELHEQN